MNDNKIFSDAQYRFRSGRSCSIQLLEILDNWTESLDKGVPIDVIYLDFAKAFDRVSHGHLIHKLHKLGIRGIVLNWIRDFLSRRTQCVRIGSTLSSWTDVVSGVPQGSVIGPILFLCFINDLPDIVSGIVKIFADDTKLFSPVTTNEECYNLQSDLDNLSDWSDKWKLTFNAKKCKVLHLGSSNSDFRYSMRDPDGNYSAIEAVTNEKDLGVTFDERLSFNQHITNITNKAQRTLGLVHRSFECLDEEMFLPLYTALIRPTLEYGSWVWLHCIVLHSI